MSVSLVALWTEVRRRLEAAGVDTPVLDARLLLEAGAGVNRLDIVTDPRRILSDAQVASVGALTARREAREPISHILGRKAFWTIELAVTADVLTPRPETEHVVEAALEMLAPEAPARVLDLGVGTGAILCAILHERPVVTGTGIDVSAPALAVARANVEALGLATRATLQEGDWRSDLGGAQFDVVVSNPPYIASDQIAFLAPEVARFEPRLALDGGADGLEAYRAIAPRLPKLLREGGGFALEVGAGQADTVASLVRAAGLAEVSIRVDLAGIGRVVTGRRLK